MTTLGEMWELYGHEQEKPPTAREWREQQRGPSQENSLRQYLNFLGERIWPKGRRIEMLMADAPAKLAEYLRQALPQSPPPLSPEEQARRDRKLAQMKAWREKKKAERKRAERRWSQIAKCKHVWVKDEEKVITDKLSQRYGLKGEWMCKKCNARTGNQTVLERVRYFGEPLIEEGTTPVMRARTLTMPWRNPREL